MEAAAKRVIPLDFNNEFDEDVFFRKPKASAINTITMPSFMNQMRVIFQEVRGRDLSINRMKNV